MTGIRLFLKDERGQDLIEFALLLSLLALSSTALFLRAGGSVSGIWSRADSVLNVNGGCPSGQEAVSNGGCVRARH